MLRNATLALTLMLTVAGCARLADSRLNPLNWFGRSREAAVATDRTQLPPLVPGGAAGQVVESRGLIDQITALEIARTPTGAIVRATGIAAGQGAYNAQLVLLSAENGSLVYDFRVAMPEGFQATGTERSRTVSVAVTLTTAQLGGLRQITVQGGRNARTTAR